MSYSIDLWSTKYALVLICLLPYTLGTNSSRENQLIPNILRVINVLQFAII